MHSSICFPSNDLPQAVSSCCHCANQSRLCSIAPAAPASKATTSTQILIKCRYRVLIVASLCLRGVDSRGRPLQKLCNPFCCLTTKLCPASRNAGTILMRHGQLPVPEDLARASAQAFAYPHLSHRPIVLLLSKQSQYMSLRCRIPAATAFPDTASTYLLHLITKEIGALTKPASRRWNVPPVISPTCVVYATVVPLALPTADYHLETKPSFLLARRITRLSVSICSQGIDLNFISCSSASTLLVLCI
jgi:hypothetical protein